MALHAPLNPLRTSTARPFRLPFASSLRTLYQNHTQNHNPSPPCFTSPCSYPAGYGHRLPAKARSYSSHPPPHPPKKQSPPPPPPPTNIHPAARPKQQTPMPPRRSGPFSARSAFVFIATGVALIVYFRHEKARMDRKRIAESTKGVGKPSIGGPFDLVDQDGGRVSDEDLRGGFSIVYFGFTHCPDICPEELDKLAQIIDLVNDASSSRRSPLSFSLSRSTPASSSPPSTSSTTTSTSESRSKSRLQPRPPLLPLFITCDPARDTPSVLGSYLNEFHASIVGLTGTWEQIQDMCKKYRVYFSTPENIKPGEDYLVDHSIYFYLMDPDGDFIEAIGRQHSAESAAKIIKEHMSDWKNGVRLS